MDGVFQESLSQQPTDSPLAVVPAFHGGKLKVDPAVVAQSEPRVHGGQSRLAHRVDDVPELGFLRAQEFSAGRGVVEEIPNLDGSAHRVGRGKGLRSRLPEGNLHPFAGSGRSGGKGQAGDRGDAGQGLSPEAQGGDAAQILGGGDLAGGVGGQDQRCIFRADAGTVVPDPDPPGAPPLHLDLDPARPRIEAVLDQLLDHRGGALHDLAGGDLVGEVLRQATDGHGR